MKVWVPQWPKGAFIFSRWPLRARPRRRVILVVVPVSSITPSRSGRFFIHGWRWSRHTRRDRTTSARSVSLASSVFFDGKLLLDQQPRQRSGMRLDPAFGQKPRRKLRHRDVAIRLDPADISMAT